MNPSRVVRVPSKYPDTFHPRRYVCRECKRPIRGRGLITPPETSGYAAGRYHIGCASVFRPEYRAALLPC